MRTTAKLRCERAGGGGCQEGNVNAVSLVLHGTFADLIRSYAHG